MININYQELITRLIDSHNGLKYQDLVLYTMAKVNPQIFEKEKFTQALEGLLEDKVIVQVLYENELTGAKVMYFPRGTKFLIGI